MDKWTKEEKAGAAWMAIAAGLLTFGNVIVELLLRALGL